MQTTKIAFIGAGNMASALAEGILQKKLVSEQNMFFVDRNQEKRDFWQRRGARVFAQAESVFGLCEVIFLAIKPQGLAEFFNQNLVALKRKVLDLNQPQMASAQAPVAFCATKPLIISVLAGTNLNTLANFFIDLPIIRAMPNLPASVGFGMSGICANTKVDAQASLVGEKLLNASGACVWVEEQQLDGVTAISGSGPGYFFYLFELMQKSAEKLGFSPEIARELVLQTALGATQMALSSGKSASQLKAMVSSKGGTTTAALQELERQKLEEVLDSAIQKAWQRAQQLSKI